MAHERRFRSDPVCWRALLLLSFADSSDTEGRVPMLICSLFVEHASMYAKQRKAFPINQYNRLLETSLVRETEICIRYHQQPKSADISFPRVESSPVDHVPTIGPLSARLLHSLQVRKTTFWALMRQKRGSFVDTLRCMTEWRHALTVSMPAWSSNSETPEEQELVLNLSFAHVLLECYLGMLQVIEDMQVRHDSVPAVVGRKIIVDVVTLCEQICARDQVKNLSSDIVSRLVATLVIHTPSGNPARELLQGVQLMLELPCIKKVPDMEDQLLCAIIQLLRQNKPPSIGQSNCRTPTVTKVDARNLEVKNSASSIRATDYVTPPESHSSFGASCITLDDYVEPDLETSHDVPSGPDIPESLSPRTDCESEGLARNEAYDELAAIDELARFDELEGIEDLAGCDNLADTNAIGGCDDFENFLILD